MVRRCPVCAESVTDHLAECPFAPEHPHAKAAAHYRALADEVAREIRAENAFMRAWAAWTLAPGNRPSVHVMRSGATYIDTPRGRWQGGVLNARRRSAS